jgi:acetoin utilization protein AcuB
VLVAEWMTREPFTLGPDDTVATAAELMARRKVRRLPIVEDGVVVGIVARSDIFRSCPAELNPFSPEVSPESEDEEEEPHLAAPLRQVMTAHPLTIRPDAPIETAALMMVDHKIGGLPVVTDQLVGILTESDLFRALTASLGAGGPGLRITFDVSLNEDPVVLILELARRHGLRLASVSIHDRNEHRTAVVRLLGTPPSTLVDDLWKTGHRVLSVLRMK